MRRYILAVIAIVVMASCTDNKDRVVKILQTGEKAPVEIPEQYVAGDTIVVFHSIYEGWKIDNNWALFEGNSTFIGDSIYRIKYMKGVIVK